MDRKTIRGEGTCIIPHGIFGSFYISRGDPDEWVKRENPFNPVVGKVDFTPPIVFYMLAVVALSVLIVVLPQIFLASDFGRPHYAATRYSELCVTVSTDV